MFDNLSFGIAGSQSQSTPTTASHIRSYTLETKGILSSVFRTDIALSSHFYSGHYTTKKMHATVYMSAGYCESGYTDVKPGRVLMETELLAGIPEFILCTCTTPVKQTTDTRKILTRESEIASTGSRISFRIDHRQLLSKKEKSYSIKHFFIYMNFLCPYIILMIVNCSKLELD